jgi:flagellar motor switch protein FliN/FliY
MTTTATQTIASLVDVPLTIEVELDHKTMTVRDILCLDVGQVLKLTRSAGENIDVKVGGALVGFGEIVILEDTMGVRITDFHEEG